MKQRIRKKVLEGRKALPEKWILAKSHLIAERLFELPKFKRSHTVMFYVSQGSEVNTHQMIKDALQGGRRVAVPVSRSEGRKLLPVIILDLDRELSPGSRGVLEPVLKKERILDPAEIDLVILPGVAFDIRGNRLGRGHAYYDNFLKETPPKVAKIALAFERQIVHNIPPAPHDVPVDKVVTEKRVIDCSGASENAET